MFGNNAHVHTCKYADMNKNTSMESNSGKQFWSALLESNTGKQKQGSNSGRQCRGAILGTHQGSDILKQYWEIKLREWEAVVGSPTKKEYKK